MPPAPAESAEAEPEAEPEVGWPLEEDEVDAEDAYPLRRHAGVGDAEAEEYTRVLGSPKPASPDDTAG
jgi:hypothetical protein